VRCWFAPQLIAATPETPTQAQELRRTRAAANLKIETKNLSEVKNNFGEPENRKGR
jgi:hypothetical protein